MKPHRKDLGSGKVFLVQSLKEGVQREGIAVKKGQLLNGVEFPRLVFKNPRKREEEGAQEVGVVPLMGQLPRSHPKGQGDGSIKKGDSSKKKKKKVHVDVLRQSFPRVTFTAGEREGEGDQENYSGEKGGLATAG